MRRGLGEAEEEREEEEEEEEVVGERMEMGRGVML